MNRALLVIDVQNEYFTGKLPIVHPEGSLFHILNAIEHANENNIPVIVIQHSAPKDSPTFAKGSSKWHIHPEILNTKYKKLIEKTFPGSFTGTDLESWLKENNIDTVVISGYMTHMCCDTTARQAFHAGFNVEFLSDATGTINVSNYAGSVTAEELHRAILVTQAMKFSRVLTTKEWINDIKGNPIS